MGKAQRTKGHSWERAVVNELKDIGYKATRILEYQTENAKGTDVKCNGFNVQCKKAKNINVREAYREMQETDQINVVAANWDRDLTLAILDWSDFKTIMEWLKEKRIH